jgi:hypothetical protein
MFLPKNRCALFGNMLFVIDRHVLVQKPLRTFWQHAFRHRQACSCPKTAAHFLATCFSSSTGMFLSKNRRALFGNMLFVIDRHVLVQKPLRTFWQHAFRH